MREGGATTAEADIPAPNTQTRDRNRYAIKTALSLTLAYLLPMALGWPQPQTAATTVMLIAATGTASESLQKGVLRLIGTLSGAIIGLSLIALFPQDRLIYLMTVSLVVAFIFYLYNAYQGDSTVFMLTAVVTLMVFNGGNAEGAFIYGVDRAYMTAFGVLIYTIIASTLWPVRVADNTRSLAGAAVGTLAQAFKDLCSAGNRQGQSDSSPAEGLLHAQEAFQAHLAAVRQDAEGVKAYLAEWSTVSHCLEQLTGILVPSRHAEIRHEPEFRRFIGNYDAALEHLKLSFQQVEMAFRGEQTTEIATPPPLEYSRELIANQGHRAIAQIAARGQLLENLQISLKQLLLAAESIAFDRGKFDPDVQPTGKPNFLWLDRESLKTGIRALVTFWIATGIWIFYNPPGGFMFVTLCTILIPLVSFTPVTPKLLFILLNLGFLFAIPAYVFLLPAMSHWLQLALFLFSYAFIGFYVFKGPVSIFFLLGLFTLGIQNTMQYNFAVILSIVLMFYLVCALLIISVNFPFTSNRARLYAGLPRRFFRNCQHLVHGVDARSGLQRRLAAARLNIGEALIGKMHAWGPTIDSTTYDHNEAQVITAFSTACDILQGQLRVAAARNLAAGDNRLINRARRRAEKTLQWGLCSALAAGDRAQIEKQFEQARTEVEGVEKRLDLFLRGKDMEQYSQQELADFYVFLNMRVAIYASLVACQDAYCALDWNQLRQHQY
ncbi:MAG: FUSC family protein [Halioglobus sp.]